MSQLAAQEQNNELKQTDAAIATSGNDDTNEVQTLADEAKQVDEATVAPAADSTKADEAASKSEPEADVHAEASADAATEAKAETAPQAEPVVEAETDAKADAGVEAKSDAEGKDAAEDAAGAVAEGEVPHFKMGDDVSAYTGRPRFTEEENRALAEGNRFFHKAMGTAARARGESYEPFRLPPHMRAALSQIDAESAQEQLEEKKRQAQAEGRELTEEEIAQEKKAIESLHQLSDEEYEEFQKLKSEKDSISAGGARFYGKYQALLEQQQERKAIAQAKTMRNVKIIGVVALGMVGYMAYNQFFVDRDAQSIESLKAALPLTIDAHTSMVRIDDRTDDFKIYFEKDPLAFEGLDEHQKEAALDEIQKNAPGLCKNPLLHSIIASGRKVTVLLEATDRSFFRQYSIDKCPTSGDKQSY